MSSCRTKRGSLYSVGERPGPAPTVRETSLSLVPKLRLLDRDREAHRTRHDSHRTGDTHVAWIRRSIFFHGKRHPAEPSETAVTPFLSTRTP